MESQIGTAPDELPTNELLGAPPRTVATIAALRALEHTNRPVQVLGYYEAGDGGGGAFFYDPGDTSSSDDGGTVIVGQGGARWKRDYRDRVSGAWFGIQGGSDETAKLQAAIDATPHGGVLRIPEVSTLIAGTLERGSASIRIDFCGNRLKPAGNTRVIDFEGGFDEVQTVSGLSVAEVDGFERTTATVADGSQYAVGDVVKIVSADPIPHGWGTNRFLGEFAVVQEISGNVVTLQSKLFDHEVYATDIKIGKLRDVSYTVENLTIEAPDHHTTGAIVRFVAARDCELINVHGVNLNNSFFSPGSLYRYVCRDCSVINSKNEPGNSLYGYGVSDGSSYGGIIENLFAERCRHAVTTNARSSRNGSAADLATGRTIFLRVVDGVARDNLAGAWDTHPGAAYVTFVDCIAEGSSSFGQSRSPYTKFINPVGIKNGRGISFGTPRSGVQSLIGNEVTNPDLECSTTGFQYYFSSDSTQGVSDSTWEIPAEIAIRGGVVRVDNASSERGILFLARNRPIDLTLQGVRFVVTNQSTNPLVFVTPSDVTRVVVDGCVVELYSEGGWSGTQRLVQFDGASADNDSVVYVLDTKIIGPGSANFSAFIVDSDGYIANCHSEQVTQDFGEVIGGASQKLAWGYPPN